MDWSVPCVLLARELVGGTVQGSAGRRTRCKLNSCAEQLFLQHGVCQYSVLQPVDSAARSTIAADFTSNGDLLATTHWSAIEFAVDVDRLQLVNPCVICSGDHTIKVHTWADPPATQQQLYKSGHERTPWTVSCHPTNPNLLLSGSLDGRVILWDVATQEAKHVVQTGKTIASCCFHPTGEVAAYCAANKVYLWPTHCWPWPGHPMRVYKSRRPLRLTAFNPVQTDMMVTAELTEKMTPAEVALLLLPATSESDRQQQREKQQRRRRRTDRDFDWWPWQQQQSEQLCLHSCCSSDAAAGSSTVQDDLQATPCCDIDKLAAAVHSASVQGDIPDSPKHSPEHTAQQDSSSASQQSSTSEQSHTYHSQSSEQQRLCSVSAEHQQPTAAGHHSSRPVDQTDQPGENRVTISSVCGSEQLLESSITATAQHIECQAHATDPADGSGSSASTRTAAIPLPDVLQLMNNTNTSTPATAAVTSNSSQTALELQLQQAAALHPADPVTRDVNSTPEPCLATLRVWQLQRGPYSGPGGLLHELTDQQQQLVLPYVVVCSERSVGVSPCGRFMVLVVAVGTEENRVKLQSIGQQHQQHQQEGRQPAQQQDADSDELYQYLDYELRVVSLEGPSCGAVLSSCPISAPDCLTCVQVSPAGDHVLLAYGKRHSQLGVLVYDNQGTCQVCHTVLQVYRLLDLHLTRQLLSVDDEVNVALWHPCPGQGIVYCTKTGRVRRMVCGCSDTAEDEHSVKGQVDASSVLQSVLR